ncbi:ROK family transcriptional regulator [Paenibacillus montanisoli]|uniref:ROK family transcriptional regulator n=1 Tax=Paenibacillus montanisoli TaxID=2081970 RepID=A0A328U4Z5_9BACL|nr:ROK family transcriptional regulator [Paenibacillus montanisoli]RAP74966.1 hypothetical protein DL346_16340 [Paenibacillus montanisoli]
MSETISTTKDMKKVILTNIRTALIASGSATKVELCEKLGISFPTISKFVSQMEKEGELLSGGFDDSSGGRRAQRYAYNPEFKLGVALFLEKMETQYTIYNCFGEVKEKGAVSGFLQDGVETLTSQIELFIERYPRIGSLAFGVPGSVNGGRIIYIPGYEKFQDFDLKGSMETRFKLPVVVENDMNAAVLGYHDKLDTRDNPSLIYLYFGQNGPGAGILVNGNVLRGSTSFSGEISFVPLYDRHNFQQAITSTKGMVTDMHEAQGIDAVSRLVSAFTAILNPSLVIFCRDEINEGILETIAAQSASYTPKEHLPKLTASDWKEDYLEGLKRLGLERMITAFND